MKDKSEDDKLYFVIDQMNEEEMRARLMLDPENKDNLQRAQIVCLTGLPVVQWKMENISQKLGFDTAEALLRKCFELCDKDNICKIEVRELLKKGGD